MTDPVHIDEADYTKNFPPDLDEFPSVVNDLHYIDAWLLNTVFNSLLATEQYLIDNKANIEAPLGDDILGIEGNPEISIPAARYTAYKSALAWDSNLLEENIAEGITIFGVTGSFEGGVTLPVITAPTHALLAAVPAVSLPAVSVA